MRESGSQKLAPHCGHDFRIVNVRGDHEAAITVADDLRRAYGSLYYVSWPFDGAEGWALALCRTCANSPR